MESWVPSYEGSDFDHLRAEYEVEVKQLQHELNDELEARRVVLFGVVHALEDVGHPQNAEFEDSLRKTTVLQRSWRKGPTRNPSFSSVFAKVDQTTVM
jgi:hypothetical protein